MLGTPVSYFPVPGCREAVIKLSGRLPPSESGKSPVSNMEATIETVIADPDYIRLAPLPSKGKIAMHPICNADISDSSVDRFGSYADDLAEVLKQAKAIKDARKGSTSATQPKAAAGK